MTLVHPNGYTTHPISEERIRIAQEYLTNSRGCVQTEEKYHLHYQQSMPGCESAPLNEKQVQQTAASQRCAERPLVDA